MDTIRKRARNNWFYSYNIIFDLDVSEHAIVIYTFLCRCADSESQCFPSYEYIGRACKIKSRTTIGAALNELEKIGLIARVAQYTKDGRQTSNCYCIYDTPRDEINTQEKLSHENESIHEEQSDVEVVESAENKENNGMTIDNIRAMDANKKDSIITKNDSVHLMDTRVSTKWTGGCPLNGQGGVRSLDTKYYP